VHAACIGAASLCQILESLLSQSGCCRAVQGFLHEWPVFKLLEASHRKTSNTKFISKCETEIRVGVATNEVK
jgi:hypothetical protein